MTNTSGPDDGEMKRKSGGSRGEIGTDDVDEDEMLSPIDFDSILHHVGEMGYYQVGLFIMICIPATIPAAFTSFIHVFISAEPDHYCHIPDLHQNMIDLNLTQAMIKEIAIPSTLSVSQSEEGISNLNRTTSDSVGSYAKCHQYDGNEIYNWLLDYNETKIYKTFMGEKIVPCQDGWIYDQSEFKNTLVTEYDLVCEKSWWTSKTLSLFFAGSLFGNILYGQIADRFGRRTSFLCVLFQMTILSIITAFSPNYTFFVVVRAINGLSFPAIFQIPFIIVIEVMGPRYRTAAGIMICLSFAVGLMMLAGLAYVFNSWFELAIVTSTPFVIMFSYYWIIPESPRWLLTKGRMVEANKIIQNIAKWNGKDIPKNFLHEFIQLHHQNCRNKNYEQRRLLAAAAAVNQEQHDELADICSKSGIEEMPTPQATKALLFNEANENDNDKNNYVNNNEEEIMNDSNTVEEVEHDKDKQLEKICDEAEHDQTRVKFAVAPKLSTNCRKFEQSSEDKDANLLTLLLHYPKSRINFMLITFNWFINAFVYSGLSYYSANLNVNAFLSFFISAAVEVPSLLIYWQGMNKMGRKWILFLTMTSGGISCISSVFVHPDSSPWIVVGFSLIGKFQIAGSFAVIYIYAGELMPTVVRSQCMGMSSFISGFGLLVFPYVNNLGSYNYILPLIILGSLSICGGCVALFLPETLNCHLPNTLEESERFNSGFSGCTHQNRRDSMEGRRNT